MLLNVCSELTLTPATLLYKLYTFLDSSSLDVFMLS